MRDHPDGGCPGIVADQPDLEFRLSGLLFDRRTSAASVFTPPADRARRHRYGPGRNLTHDVVAMSRTSTSPTRVTVPGAPRGNTAWSRVASRCGADAQSERCV